MVFCAISDNSIIQFITVTIIFVLVLAITYFTTRWVGSYQKSHMSHGSIKIIESMRLSANKVLEIVKAGDKTFLIAVCKDTVTFIGEVNEDTLELKEPEGAGEAFGTVFNRFRFSRKEEADDEEEK
ncbi:MAG: flagellar biosynthetic protein FliO [Butyrivibrio sp.]|nr:flagellar biosynthetic protein FliO [Butyrivibrio sp.]